MDRRDLCILSAKAVILVVVLLPSLGSSQTDVEVECTWDSPVGGTPVDHYVLEHQINDEPWRRVAELPNTRYVLVVAADTDHRIRIAGVDANGSQGPYSIPSPTFRYTTETLESPGQPGKPILN